MVTSRRGYVIIWGMNLLRKIPGYEYKIDKTGNIYNKSGAKMKTWVSPQGYMRVGLRRNGSKKQFFVHRLIAITYIPNPSGLPIINHIDGDKLNNNVGNLEWCTHSHNSRHAQKLGLTKVKKLVHSTVDGYVNWKCRCDKCTLAWKNYFRPRIKRYRQQKKENVV